MRRPIDQALNFVSQDTIAALNEMVGDGFISNYILTLENIENRIFSDANGTFVEASGEPCPGTFSMLRTLRALKDDLRTLNALCPESQSEVNAENY